MAKHLCTGQVKWVRIELKIDPVFEINQSIVIVLGHDAIVDLLLDSESDVNIADKSGMTALDYAAAHGTVFFSKLCSKV